MTMLDRMRRHKSWLKWSLALVCLAFVVFYIPAFLDSGGQDGLGSDVVAQVDGRDITADSLRRSYQAQLAAYRNAYGGNISEQMLKQLGIGQQVLQQLVDEQAAIAEARRQGIDVTDDEVAQRILAMPAFQQNGQFNEARYRMLLNSQRPPLSVPEFEDGLRRNLIVEKLRAAVTGWLTIDDSDVAAEYRRRNEKVKLDVVAFPSERFRTEAMVTDAEVASHFEGHKEQYRIGERRKVRYVLVDTQALRSQVTVPARDIERAYNENIEMYTTPEQVRASQILFKTEGKDEAAVRAQAEKVLKEAKGGADFAGLAKKYSEDTDTAKQGGDLDYFSRGRMVPEFEQAAFSMAPGTISDLVKSQYGFHIIKLVDKKAGAVRPLEEVRQQILDQVQWELAQTRAGDEAEAMDREIERPGDLDKAAAKRGLKVQESGYFTREEPVMALGPSPEAAEQIFALKEGQVTGGVRVSRGYAFLALTGVQAPHVPKLDEVKERVREDLVKQKAREIARQKAAAVSAEAKSSGDLAKAAKAAGVEMKTTELVPRESPIPEVGVSAQVDAVAFKLPAGAVSDPIVADNAVALIKVVERKDPTDAEFAAEKDRLREDLLAERRNRFFSAYMVKAKQGMEISVNRQTLQRALGI
jgi:peptidyl-prolyl cis-trans isomerase D